MSHTPGLWKIGTPSIVTQDARLIFGNGIHVASVPVIDDEDFANARLIAAAPEMLEILRTLVGRYFELGPKGVQFGMEIEPAIRLINRIDA